MTVLDAEFVTVEPLTVRLPVIVKSCDMVTLPEELIEIASVSPAEPI